MNADPDAAIGLKLDTPNIDPKKLFANAGVPIRGIDAEPPLSENTNFAENRKYADYDAILVSDSGHFIPLEQPEEFNRDLSRWILALSKRATNHAQLNERAHSPRYRRVRRVDESTEKDQVCYFPLASHGCIEIRRK